MVSAWGENVILCEYGFRAPYMQLEALVLGQKTIDVFGFPVCAREAYEQLARRYGVPLFLPAQVEAFSRKRGVVFETYSPHVTPQPPYGAAASTVKPDAF